MFIICSIFALIISCKNDAISKDLETSVQDLESAKQVEQEIKEEFNGLLNILETKDVSKLDTSEIEKIIQELKNKVDKSDAKKTSLEKYREYEEQIKKIKEKLKDKGNIENKLNELEDSLKKKKEERKKALNEAKQKFEGFKGQVESATGVSSGEQSRNQGQVGTQAWKCANDLGYKNMTSSGSSDTSNMTKEIIENALKKIEEELKNFGEGTQNSEEKK
ncbi:ErpL protein [Borreliella tanukii]|uniref:ErpL protein n=1 Tax=Borreliella tanukii TaxID=56146 RepID=UPI003CC92028